jgi:hypothetical protein
MCFSCSLLHTFCRKMRLRLLWSRQHQNESKHTNVSVQVSAVFIELCTTFGWFRLPHACFMSACFGLSYVLVVCLMNACFDCEVDKVGHMRTYKCTHAKKEGIF